MKNKIVTREIINKDLEFKNFFDGKSYDYDAFCGEINRIQRTLLENGAKKGDKVAMVHHRINLFHAAAIFAITELGLQLLVIDMPATVESLPYSKMSLCGPVEFTIYDGYQFPDRPLKKMVETYSQKILYATKFSDDTSPVNIPWEVIPDDPLLITSSSGTTNWSKRTIFPHSEIYDLAYRNAFISDYTETDRIAHSKNLHHGASLFITFLPAMITCKSHLGATMADYTDYFASSQGTMNDMVEVINNGKYNRFMITSEYVMDDFFRTVDRTIGRFDETLIITIYVFTVNEKLVDICKRYNVEFLSTFGSIDAHINPLTANRITKDSTIIPRCIGKLKDDFYKLDKFENGLMTFTHPTWDEPHTIADTFEMLDDGNIILKARILDENQDIRSKVEAVISTDFAIVQNGDDKYLALFENLQEHTPGELKEMFGFKNAMYINKLIFFAEAKLNYDALRGHFIYYDKD